VENALSADELEQLEDDLLRRTRAVALATTVVASLALAACGSGSGDDSGGSSPLVVQSWGGETTAAEQAAFYEPFTEKTGIEVKVVEATSEARSILKQQVTSKNVTWDLVTGFTPEGMSVFNEQGLLEQLDYDKIPTAEKLSEGAKLPYAMGYDIESVVAAYSTRSGVKALSSMKDFFDTKNFPGPRAAPNWGSASMQCEIALLADGVPESDLYPLDTDRCFKVWDRVKSSMQIWYTSGSQLAQGLVDNSVDYCMCWDGRVQQAMQTNKEWDYTFDGGMSYFDYMGIPKGSKHVAEAQKLLDFVAEAEPQAAYASKIKYGPANPDAVPLLDPAMEERSAVSPENAAVTYRRPEDKVAVVTAGDEALLKAWDTWIAQ
jgi:putative spermidine/putrescine transport system substrate-binding protein